MSIDFTSNNRYVQVGVNHGNIYTCTQPRSDTRSQDARSEESRSQDTRVSSVGDSINAATTLAPDHTLTKAQRCLDMVQYGAS
jgi:hypothetical protein